MKATRRFTAALLVALLSGCAGLPAAQMALPAPLAGQPPERLEGLGGGSSGNFSLAGREGRFERSASRLALFGDTLAFERFSAGYSSDGVQARCRARQTTAQAGLLASALRPYELHCRFSGSLQGELVLAGRASGGERSGHAMVDGVALALRSVHRVQGSPLALEAPMGYLITHEGRAVGAVEMNGTPRVWRPGAGAPVHAAVTQAVLALALLWEAAGSS